MAVAAHTNQRVAREWTIVSQVESRSTQLEELPSQASTPESNRGVELQEPEPTPSSCGTALQPDIVFLFLEEVCRLGGSPYTIRRTLYAAALVCRAWLYPAQQLLWRKVDINKGRRFNALRRSIRDNDARGTEPFKQTRVLRLWEKCFRANDHGFPITLEGVGKLLLGFPRVEDLLVSGVPPVSPSFDTSDLEVSAIRPPHIPPLTVLRILGAQPAIVHIFLHAFPTLRFVLLDELPAGHAVSDVASTSLRSPRCKLYELRWEFSSIPLTPHTLQSSIETLRILSLHSFPRISNLSELFTPHLRSLCVSDYDPVLCDAVSHCSALEEFILWQDTPRQDLLDALPDTLEHMGFNCTGPSRPSRIRTWNISLLSEITVWLRNGTHMRLHTISCFCPISGPAVWPDFVNACHVMSLELICFAIPHRCYPQWNEVLGEVTRFPRPTPLSRRIRA